MDAAGTIEVPDDAFALLSIPASSTSMLVMDFGQQIDGLAFKGGQGLRADPDFAALETCTQLTSLHFVYESITDENMSHFRPLSRLEHIALHDAFVTGAQFDVLGGMEELRSLDLGLTKLREGSIERLPDGLLLERLVLAPRRGGNDLTEDDYRSVTRFGSLSELHLPGLRDEALDDIASGLPRLTTLDLDFIEGRSTTFNVVGGIESLRRLRVDARSITGSDLELASNPALTELRISGRHDLAGKGVPDEEAKPDDLRFDSFEGLEELELWCQPGPHEFASACRHDRLRRFGVGSRRITDSQASAIGELRLLEDLTLWADQAGPLTCEAITRLTKLRALSLESPLIGDEDFLRILELPNLRWFMIGGGGVTKACVRRAQDEHPEMTLIRAWR
jgi:hypothetical protein